MGESATRPLMASDRDPLCLNPEIVLPLLEGFIRNEVEKVGLTRVVVGLSGGIDSSLSTFLASRALGAENICAVMMPYRSSNPASLADAERVASVLGVRSMTVPITEQVEAYFAKFPDMDRLRRANKMARERMTILYDQSLAQNALVLGTSNKTELLLGYGTIYGDMASALNPIGDLYKTQVRQLAREVGVPAEIIEKPPTADLWPGQTDEAELGFTYERVDRLLYFMVDKRYTETELVELGFEPAFIGAIARRVQNSQYKRRLPLIAKVSTRTIDSDFRYPRDWGR